MTCFLLLCYFWISTGVGYAETTKTKAAKCNFDWNITKVEQETLIVIWSGDGYGDVSVTLTESCSGISCRQSSLTAKYSEKIMKLKTWSKNTKYDVEITFNCAYSNEKRIKTIWTPPAETPDTTAEIAGLKAYTFYEVQVAAKNEDFWGEMSEKFQVRTEPGVPGVPLDIRVTLTNTSIHLLWNEPKPFAGPIVNYTVWWELYQKTEDLCRTPTNLHGVERCLPKTANTTRKYFDIIDLHPYREYKVKVRAYTLAGDGKWSEEKIYKTLPGIPNKPKIFGYIRISSESLMFWWDEPVPNTGDIQQYITSLNLEHIYSQSKTTVDREVSFKGLSPSTLYLFTVAAVTSAGVGPDEHSSAETRPGAPGPPELAVERIRDTSITVSWKHSAFFIGARPTYTLQWGGVGNSSKTMKFDNITKACKITDLTPFTMYQVQIRSSFQGMDGSWSEAQWIRTQIRDSKPAITIREIHLLEGRSVQVNWTTSGEYPGLINYILKAWNVPVPFSDCFNKYQPISIVGTISREDWTSSHSDFVTDLRPFQKYVFEILLYNSTTNEVGWSDIAKAIQIPPAAAEEPTNVIADCSFNSTQVTVSWKPPKDFTGNISSYVVNYTVQNESFSVEIPVSNMCEEQNLVLSVLKPERSYNIGVYARVQSVEEDGKVARLQGECALPTVGVSHMDILLGTIVSVLILGILVAGVRRMRRKFKLDNFKGAIPQSSGVRDQSLALSEQEMEESSSSRLIKCKNFDHYIRIMMSDHHLKFSQQFEMLENESPHLPCTVAEREINSSKNRWKDLLPFDHSRVKLLPLSDVPGSDFINANYIPGISSGREYIGCQGPLSNTVDDFWRMIWEQSVSMVVMLTQCMERDVKTYKQKCEQYWPDNGKSNHYGDLRVTCVVEYILPSFVIREFHVELDPYERQVKQMHFTHWPHFGSPKCPEVLLNFVKAVRANLPKEEAGPILVHCSAGVGRTGTYIVVDRLSQQLQVPSDSPEDDTVNIYSNVLELRKHRTNMVQTEDQYIYVYLCANQLIREREESQREVCEELV